MGKTQNEQSLPSTTLDAQGTTCNGCCLNCSRLQKLVSLRCIFLLMLSFAVFLSALFWLPFFHFGGSEKDLDLEFKGHDIVASFLMKKPTSYLQEYILRLEDDIFYEMSFSNTKVDILYFEPSVESNITKVVFAVKSDATTQSLIRESFVNLITHRSLLHLTASLFGDPFSFEVLKFKGGITASPVQKAYLPQNILIKFDFTLNFSIDQILDNFDALRSQLRNGLHLAPYENLYIRLTNLKGSTVAQPTTVRSEVLLAMGIKPSKSRSKQLAQKITGPDTENLGLNDTVFGRVKQVRLSSMSPLSPRNAPSPAPYPSTPPHHHHHHHHYASTSLPPRISPSPAPVLAPEPKKNKPVEPPGCPIGYKHKQSRHSHLPPSEPPVYAPHNILPHSQPKQRYSPTPKISPVQSPLPNVAYVQKQPPTKEGEFHARSPAVMPLVSPSPAPSSAGIFSSNMLGLPLFILLVLHL